MSIDVVVISVGACTLCIVIGIILLNGRIVEGKYIRTKGTLLYFSEYIRMGDSRTVRYTHEDNGPNRLPTVLTVIDKEEKIVDSLYGDNSLTKADIGSEIPILYKKKKSSIKVIVDKPEIVVSYNKKMTFCGSFTIVFGSILLVELFIELFS